jgi:hypothetical protein
MKITIYVEPNDLENLDRFFFDSKPRKISWEYEKTSLTTQVEVTITYANYIQLIDLRDE